MRYPPLGFSLIDQSAVTVARKAPPSCLVTAIPRSNVCMGVVLLHLVDHHDRFRATLMFT